MRFWRQLILYVLVFVVAVWVLVYVIAPAGLLMTAVFLGIVLYLLMGWIERVMGRR
jgi:hypothetical protein